MKNNKKFAAFVALGATAVALTMALHTSPEQQNAPAVSAQSQSQSVEHVSSRIQAMRNQALNPRHQNDGEILLDAKGKPVPAIWPDGTPVLDDAGKTVYQRYHETHRPGVTYG
jgi:hypothetical protein